MMRVFRLCVIAFVSILFIAAPVSAQQAQSVSVSGDITPAGLLVAGGAIIVAIVGGVFALATKYIDYKLAAAGKKQEATDAIAKAERDAEAVQRADQTKLIEAVFTLGKGMSDQATAAAKDRDAASIDRKTLLEIVETKDSAAAGRKEVNKHTEEVVEPVVKVIETAAKDIREAVVNVPTMEQFKKELASQLDPILEQLTEFGARFAVLVKQGDSSPSLTRINVPTPTTEPPP